MSAPNWRRRLEYWVALGRPLGGDVVTRQTADRKIGEILDDLAFVIDWLLGPAAGDGSAEGEPGDHVRAILTDEGRGIRAELYPELTARITRLAAHDESVLAPQQRGPKQPRPDDLPFTALWSN